MPRTSVVIRCLNEEEHIGRLLTGLLRQRQRPDEILLVDSGSTDATLEIASRFPTRVLHIAPAEFSFGRALNRGCAAATGDVAVFVSAHVYPLHVTWLQEMVAPFEDPRTALTYGRQVGNEQTRFSEHQIFSRWFPAQDDSDQRHPFCNNANAAVRLSAWRERPYDEELTGLEDLDWAKHALAEGSRIAYVAGAPVAHVHDEAWSQVVNRYRREAIAHKAIYEDARMSSWEAAGLVLASVGVDLLQAARQGAVRSAPDIVAFRLAQFLGTYQGFAQSGPVQAQLKRRFYYPGAPRELQSFRGPADRELIDYARVDHETHAP